MATEKKAAAENKDKRAKLLYGGVIAVLVLIFVVGFIYGLNQVLSMEGAYSPAELTDGISAIPESKEDAAAYFYHVLDLAVAGKPKFRSHYDFGADTDSLEAGEEARLKTTLLFISDAFEDRLDEAAPAAEADFGEGFADKLRRPVFTAADVEAFTNDYIYYQCISCGETAAEPQDACDACGSDYPYQMKYRDANTLTLTLKNSEASLNGNFTVRDHDEILALLGDLSGVAAVDSVDVEYTGLQILFRVDRATDELQYLEFRKEMAVRAMLSFPGELAMLPPTEVSLPMTEKEQIDFTWPALELSAHSMSLEPKGTDNLLATLICDDPVQYEARWDSSDRAVVDVDDEGYLKAGKQPGTAEITASYEFGGKTYTDTCTVEVKIPVESLTLAKKKVSMKAGDTFALKYKIAPKDATHQDATFVSSDPAVVTVDETGVITAVSAGTAKVEAYSVDGYFRSTCEVTVK